MSKLHSDFCCRCFTASSGSAEMAYKPYLKLQDLGEDALEIPVLIFAYLLQLAHRVCLPLGEIKRQITPGNCASGIRKEGANLIPRKTYREVEC